MSDDDELNRDDSLLGLGIIDSTGVLELVAFIEKSFGLKVDDRELVPENLDSIENIVSFVSKKLQMAARVEPQIENRPPCPPSPAESST